MSSPSSGRLKKRARSAGYRCSRYQHGRQRDLWRGKPAHCMEAWALGKYELAVSHPIAVFSNPMKPPNLTVRRAVLVWVMFWFRIEGVFCLWLGLVSAVAVPEPAPPAESHSEIAPTNCSPTATLTYENPPVLIATIYRMASTSGQPLFKFKRTATRSGNRIHVLREFSYPDGKLAARERVVYQDNALVHYELDELQTGAKGTADVEQVSANRNKARILFHYSKNASTYSSTAAKTEPLVSDTLINDMVGPFLMAHWDQLVRGEKVGCRFIVVPRRETVGFTFRKESETQWHGREVVIVRMEPSSMLISALVDPLHFVVEKNAPHHVLEYNGRTTPKLSSNGHWTDLDAVTIFDW